MLTAEQIGQFHRDGVLALRGVFDRDEVRALQRAADEVTAEAVAGRGHGHGYREVTVAGSTTAPTGCCGTTTPRSGSRR